MVIGVVSALSGGLWRTVAVEKQYVTIAKRPQNVLERGITDVNICKVQRTILQHLSL